MSGKTSHLNVLGRPSFPVYHKGANVKMFHLYTKDLSSELKPFGIMEFNSIVVIILENTNFSL